MSIHHPGCDLTIQAQALMTTQVFLMSPGIYSEHVLRSELIHEVASEVYLVGPLMGNPDVSCRF